MSVIILEHRFYKLVSAMNTQNSDYIIPNGCILVLNSLGGNSPTTSSLSYMTIIWDPTGENTMLFGTYSAGFQQSSVTLFGDGNKILRISLVNNELLASRVMGGYILGALSDG